MARINRKRGLLEQPITNITTAARREREFVFDSENNSLEVSYVREVQTDGRARYAVSWRKFRGRGIDAQITMLASGFGGTRREAFEELKRDIANVLAFRLKGLNQEFD